MGNQSPQAGALPCDNVLRQAEVSLQPEKQRLRISFAQRAVRAASKAERCASLSLDSALSQFEQLHWPGGIAFVQREQRQILPLLAAKRLTQELVHEKVLIFAQNKAVLVCVRCGQHQAHNLALGCRVKQDLPVVVHALFA
jgi:hypothetical protein